MTPPWLPCRTTQACMHKTWRGFYMHVQPGDDVSVWSVFNAHTKQLKTGTASAITAAQEAADASVLTLTVDPAMCIVETARDVRAEL